MWGDVARYRRCARARVVGVLGVLLGQVRVGRLVRLAGGEVARCGEMWGDVGRCGKIWGDVGRCGEMLASPMPQSARKKSKRFQSKER